jgi:cell division protein FtsQ
MIRNLLALVIVIALVVGGVWGWRQLHQPGTLPIKTVKVKGQYQYVSADTLKQTLLPYVKAGFFNVNINAAQDSMMAIPGVASASIRRIWPDTVQISIAEQNAIARWQLGGFVTADGIVFVPKQSDVAAANALPLFVGQVSDIPTLLSMYPQFNQLLAPIGLHVTMLSVDALGDWQLRVDKGFLIDLGSENALPRLQEFVTGYPALVASDPTNTILYVDMRYRDGFAVKWQYGPGKKPKSNSKRSKN